MPWLVQTWIDGYVATPDGLSTSPDFARDLAHLIGALRKVELKGRTFSGPGRGGKLTDHDDWMEVCFTKSENLLDVIRLRRMWRRFRELPPSRADAMSHKDLIPTNLLVQDGRLIGVLDTGGFGPADRALDLVAGWHLMNRDARTIFREALEVDDVEWQRGAAWAFQQAIGLVWYYKDSNPRHGRSRQKYAVSTRQGRPMSCRLRDFTDTPTDDRSSQKSPAQRRISV